MSNSLFQFSLTICLCFVSTCSTCSTKEVLMTLSSQHVCISRFIFKLDILQVVNLNQRRLGWLLYCKLCIEIVSSSNLNTVNLLFLRLPNELFSFRITQLVLEVKMGVACLLFLPQLSESAACIRRFSTPGAVATVTCLFLHTQLPQKL